ncbi:MAG: hypothetical protein IJU95_06700, partial [Treponema sp.]|nr:hypothetical protein [Treponema sp.]
GILAGMTLLFLLGYLLAAAIYGGIYKVSFAMTQSELAYSQDSEQLKKMRGMAIIAAVGGAATGNFGAAGGALASVSRNRRDVWFHKVKRIKIKSRRNTIYLGIHPVYAEAADFDFVRNFIIPRCPKAKVTGQ